MTTDRISEARHRAGLLSGPRRGLGLEDPLAVRRIADGLRTTPTRLPSRRFVQVSGIPRPGDLPRSACGRRLSRVAGRLQSSQLRLASAVHASTTLFEPAPASDRTAIRIATTLATREPLEALGTP